MKAKTYYFYKEKYLYRKKRYFLIDKLRIECIGGDNMSEEKELVFIKPEDVPKVLRFTHGRIGRDWNAIFSKIPKGKVLVMDTETYGSAPHIRNKAKEYSERTENIELESTQRTNKDTENVTIYVQRVK